MACEKETLTFINDSTVFQYRYCNKASLNSKHRERESEINHSFHKRLACEGAILGVCSVLLWLTSYRRKREREDCVRSKQHFILYLCRLLGDQPFMMKNRHWAEPSFLEFSIRVLFSSLYVQVIIPLVFRVTWSFRNHLILLLWELIHFFRILW